MKTIPKQPLLHLLISLLFLLITPIAAQLPTPEMDGEPGPFCFYTNPVDRLGFPGCAESFRVVPEGYIDTGRVEAVLMAGPDLLSLNRRLRTLTAGHLPIINYTLTRAGVKYGWTIFATTLDGKPGSTLMAFIRVTARNLEGAPRPAACGVALRFRGPHSEPVRDFPYHRQWLYKITDDTVRRNGKTLLLYPPLPAPKTMATLATPYAGPFRGVAFDGVEQTPVCPVIWSRELAIGGTLTAEFYLPLKPLNQLVIPLTRAALAGGFSRYLRGTRKFWEASLAGTGGIQLPEKRIRELLRTALVRLFLSPPTHRAMPAFWSLGFANRARACLQHQAPAFATSPWWEPYPSDHKPFWEVDLGGPQSVQRVIIKTPAGTRPLKFLLKGTRDGEQWFTLADFNKSPAAAMPAGLSIPFLARALRYLRITYSRNNRAPTVRLSRCEVSEP